MEELQQFQGNWMEQVSKKQEELVLQTNSYTGKFGLSLTETDVKILGEERKRTLQEQQRIEFGTGIMPKLIFTFCDSSFIHQDSYRETLIRLQDIFYLYKNETHDRLSDDELLEKMKQIFEGPAKGDLDYLEGMYDRV